MADLATITIPVDSSAMVRAVKDAKSLERGIKMLVDAFDSGTIGSQQLSKGLLQLKREYEGLFGTSQKATASVRGHAKSLQESKAATAAATAAEERLILAKKKAETAYSLGMQKAKEEARAIAELDRVKQASAAREDMLRQKYDESYRAMVIYRTQIKELNEALSVGALNQGAYKERIEQLNQSLANGTIVMGGYTAQAANGMNKFGVAAQQTGYQVSDFLVQVQGGTNPLVAFSQQATQLAGLLYLMPERFQMARLAVLGFSVSVATAISVVTIGIPLLAMLAMNFFSSGEKAEDGAKGIDKYKEAIEGLKSAIGNVQEEINKLTFGTEDAAIAGARKAMVDAQAEIAALTASQRKVRGVAAPTAEEQAAIDKAVASYRELVVNLNELNAKQAALAEAQNMLNGGLSVASGIQKALVYEKENELRVARELAAEADTILKKLDRLTRLDLAGMFNSAGLSVGTMNARLDSTLVKLRGILGAIGSIGFDTVGIQAETKALQAGMSQAQARVEAQVARMEASLAQSGETGALAAAGLATYRKALEDNAAAQEALTKEVDARTEATKGGAKADKEATKAAEDLRKELEAPLVSAVGSVSDAFGDFVARGLTDFKGFVQSILASFQNMIAQMIAMAVKNRIMLSLGIGGLTPTMAAAGQIPGIGAAGGMLGSFGGGAGMAGLAGGTGFLGGFGNVVGGLASGGLAGAGGAIGGALGSGSFATAAGAIAAPLLAVAAVFSFFKKKTKELDSGLRVTVNNMETLVETFKTVQTTRFFGLSKKTTTTVGAADAEVANPITNAVSAIQSDILKMAGVLSIGSDAFKDFSYQMDISLKGLTEEQAAAKVQEELAKVGDAFADLIPNLSSFAVEGETTSQTLVRLFNSLQTANFHFQQLIGTMFQASLSGASLASTLIQAFGSIDAFNSSMAFFTQNFYSEAEQVGMASDRVLAAFQALGLAAPATAAAFRALVEGLMRDVTAGVAGAAATLAGVLATQQDVATVDAYNTAQALAAQQAAERAAEQARAARQAAAQAAAQRAQQAQQEAAQKAEKIAQERYNLESQLLQLQGNTAELRRRELNLLDPTNRALQEMIWKLEDAKDAMTEISEVDFATKVDYLRAVGLARNNIPGFAAGGVHMGGPRIVGEGGPELEVTGPSRIYSNQDTASMFRDPNLASAVNGLRREVSSMRSEQLQIQVETSKNVKRIYDIERKWDTDGLPPERV